MKEWFDNLAPRERVMVATAAVVAAVAFLYMGVWQPLDRAVADLREDRLQAQELAGWMASVRNQAASLQGKRRDRPIRGRDESLLSLVDQTSRDAGLGKTVSRIQPEGDDQAAVTLEGAGFNQLIFWLRDLERDYGIRPAALTINRGEKAGTVSARLTLKREAA